MTDLSTKTPAAPKPKQEEKPSASTSGPWLAFLACILAVGAALGPLWQDKIFSTRVPDAGYSSPDDLDDLRQDLSALAEKFSAREAQDQTQDVTSEAIAAQAAEIATLRAELAALKSAPTAPSGEAVAIALAYIRLREASRTALSFADALAALCQQEKLKSFIAAPCTELEPVAATGAATQDMLRERLATLGETARLAAEAAAIKHWWQRILWELEHIISIRKIGAAPGMAESQLREIDAAIGRGDYATALATLDLMSADAQKQLAVWRTDVALRHKLELNLDAIATALGAGDRQE